MKKITLSRLLLPIVLFVLPTTGAAQKSTVRTNSLSATIIGLEYAYEHPLARKFTLVGRAGLSLGLARNDFWLGLGEYGSYSYSQTNVFLTPYLSVEPRFYYNLDRRATKGKNTSKNSANFLSLNAMYGFPSIAQSDWKVDGRTVVAPVWGLRRVYHNHLLLEFYTGLGVVAENDGAVGAAMLLGLRVGFAF